MEWLSPSKITTFLQCPLKFKWTYVEPKPQPPAPQLIRGNFVHSIIEALIGLPAEQRTIEKARELARTIWLREYAREAAPLNLDKKAESEFKWEAWWCVENYFKLEDPTQVNPLGLERWVKGKVGAGKVRGKVDRFDRDEDGIVVTDYKTGKKPGKPEWEVDHILQLNIYASLLTDELKEEVKRAVFLYLGDGQKATHDVTEESLESARKTVTTVHIAVQEKEQTGEFEPRTSKLCDWCPFKSECPAWN